MKTGKLIALWLASLAIAATVGAQSPRNAPGLNEPKYVDVALQKLCARSLDPGERVSVSGSGYKTYVEFVAYYTDPDSRQASGKATYPR